MPFEKMVFLHFTKKLRQRGEELSPQLEQESLDQLELEFRSFAFHPCVELAQPVIFTLRELQRSFNI